MAKKKIAKKGKSEKVTSEVGLISGLGLNAASKLADATFSKEDK
jgi:hypothetical protein